MYLPQKDNARSISNVKNGFTLIEVMVVVLIIALIASFAMISYTSIRVKSRDIRRVTSINTLHTALNAYYKDHGEYPAIITPGQTFRNSTNTKTYLDEVPFNPQPRTDHNCPDSEFVYKVSTDKQSYSLSVCTGADNNPNKGKLIYSTKEGIFHCGDTITDRDGFTYKTVSIGTQCWMAENLRTRTLPNGSCINTQKRCQGNPRNCEKDINCPPYLCINYNDTMSESTCSWLFNGIEYSSSSRADGLDCSSTTILQGTTADCDAGRTLYSPYEALQCQNSSAGNGLGGCLAPTDTDVMCCAKKPGTGNDFGAKGEWRSNQNVQGLCPDGWHIPSDGEFSTLEIYLTDTPLDCNPNRSLEDGFTPAWQCEGAGKKLKAKNSDTCPDCGESGFNAQLIGSRMEENRDEWYSSCLTEPDLYPPLLPDRCRNIPGNHPAYNYFPVRTLFRDYGTIGTFITSNIGNSSDLSGANAVIREVNSTTNKVSRRGVNISYGPAFSVRCIKD